MWQLSNPFFYFLNNLLGLSELNLPNKDKLINRGRNNIRALNGNNTIERIGLALNRDFKKEIWFFVLLIVAIKTFRFKEE